MQQRETVETRMSNRWPVLRGRVAAAKAALAQFRNLEREQSSRPALAFTLGLLLRGWESLRTVPGIRARSQTLAAVAVTLALAAVVLAELQSSMAVSVLLPPLAERMRSVAGPGPNRQVRF